MCSGAAFVLRSAPVLRSVSIQTLLATPSRPLSHFLASPAILQHGSAGWHATVAPLCRGVHMSAALCAGGMHKEPKEWVKYNEVLYPPQAPGEPRRPAEVVHQRANIKYSTKKLWYIACMIRGMSVDEAIKQLSFYKRKGSAVVKEVILEAQEMAVRDHNVEYKSNLWIEDSFVRKAKTVYGLRRHAKGRFCRIHYRYTHYFLRLREGRPPKHYYPPRPTGHEMVEGTLAGLRARTIQGSL